LSLHKASRDGVMSKTDADVEDNVMIVEMGAAGYSGGSNKRALIATWQDKTVEEAVEVLSKPDVEVMNQLDKETILPRLQALADDVRDVYRVDDLEREAATEEAARRAADAVRQEEEEAARAQEADHSTAMSVIDAEIMRTETAKREAAEAEDYEQAKRLKLEIERLQASKAEKISSYRAQRSSRSDSSSSGVADADATLASLDVRLRELEGRLGQAKTGEAYLWDIPLIKTLENEIKTVKSDQRSATTARKRAEEVARLREEEEKRQAAATEQARRMRQAALAAAGDELEFKKMTLKGQMAEAGKQGRMSMVSDLQQEFKVTLYKPHSSSPSPSASVSLAPTLILTLAGNP
jgi:hypothetical protein